MNQQKITPYDVTDRFYNVISELAARCGINFDEFYNRQNFNGVEIRRGIEISKEYRGKVLAVAREWTDDKGNSYPNFVFHTEKHGGITEKFNGFTAWCDAEKYGNYTPQPVSPEELKRREMAKLKAQQEQAKRDQWRADKFSQELETFKTLPKAQGDFVYLVAKFGVYAALVATFTDLRIGKDDRGEYVIYELKSGRETVGFQKIYDRNISKEGDSYRDKDITGTKKGAFHVIGDIKKAHKGLYFAEGFATAAAIHLATGQPVVVCLDANNLIEVVRKFAAHGYRRILICADNDTSTNGNIGIYSAIKAAHGCEKARVFVPYLDEKKCDYADVLKEKGLPALKAQLKTRLNDYELATVKTPLEYQAQLLNYAPPNQLKRVIAATCHAVAAQIPSQFLLDDGIKFVQDRINARGFEFSAAWLINKILIANKKPIIERNTITDKGVIYHDVTGKTADQIAALMKKTGGIWLDNRAMASGKTETMAALVKLYDRQSCAYITHRIALTVNSSTRLNLLHYSEDGAQSGTNVCVCVNSIAEKFNTSNYDVALFDEFRQTKETVLDGEVDKRLQVFERMKATIQNGKLVVLADADLSNDDVNFIRSITDKPIHTFKPLPPSSNKIMAVLPSIDTLRKHALDALKRDEYSVIGSDTKIEAEKTYQYLLKNGISESDLLLIHADNRNEPHCKAFLDDPNAESIKYKCVLHSPVISSGVSITNGHFTTNYGILTGSTLPTNECLQSIARNRSAQTVYVAFAPERNRDAVENIEILKDGEVRKRSRFINGLIELHQLDHLRIELRARRAADSNNFKNNFLTLAELKGYTLRHEQCAVIAPIVGLSSDIKAAKIQALSKAESIDDKTARYYKNKATTLIESNQLERHKVEDMAGTTAIDDTDIENYLKDSNALVYRIANHELIEKSDYELTQSDLKNHITRDRLSSNKSKAWLMRQVLAMVIGQQITNVKAAEICAWLTANAAEFAANGLGNYTKQSARPLLTLANLLKRFGYDLKQVGRETTGRRKLLFNVEVNPLVLKYVTARKQRGSNEAPKQTTLETAQHSAVIYETLRQ